MSRINFIPARNKPAHLIVRNPIYRAFGRKPIAHDRWVTLSLDARMILARVELGAMEPGDRGWLACTNNITMILAERHCTETDLAAVVAARAALGRADKRAAQGKAWNLDGPGREAMRRALEIHDEQIKVRGQAALTDAILEMHGRTARGLVVGAGS